MICIICLEEIKTIKSIKKLKCNCKIFYHQDCIDKWLTIKNSCPQCNKTFNDEYTVLLIRNSIEIENENNQSKFFFITLIIIIICVILLILFITRYY